MARLQRFIVIGIIVAIIALLIYGYFTDQLPIRRPGGSVISPPASSTGLVEGPMAAPGQQFTFGAGTYTVTAIERTASIGGTQAPAGGSFVTIQISVRNGGREPMVFTPTTFQLFDSAGRRYTVNTDLTQSLASRDRQNFTQATIQPGLAANGVVVFDVAPDATGLVLRITQGYQDVALNQ